MSDNIDVTRRIRGLLNMTIENGASEAEAIAAAEKARELMDQHRITMSDLEIRAEPVIQIYIDREYKIKRAPADYILFGIDELCGVKTWYSYKNRRCRVSVLGLKSDVDMAHYLYKAIERIIRINSDIYFKDCLFRNHSTTMSFRVGMAIRINQRLKAMANTHNYTAKTSSGTELIVVKNSMVEEAYEKLNLKFRNDSSKSSGITYSYNSDAYRDGLLAGDRVNLSRPLTQRPTPQMLENE